MPNEETKNQEVLNEDEQFINSLLGADEDEVEAKKAEEAQRIKNKNAEEARKRREAEAKAKAEEGEEPQGEATQEEEAEEEPKEDVEEPKEEVKVEEAKKEPKEDNVNQLGKQLVSFKQKYPEVDLEQLDNDKAFKRYIDGKLLGAKDFTNLYEEFVEMKAEIQGVESKSIERNYIKAQSSSGTSSSTSTTTGDVYSEEEMRKLSQRIPLMNPKDVAKIEEKLKRSIAYYETN